MEKKMENDMETGGIWYFIWGYYGTDDSVRL